MPPQERYSFDITSPFTAEFATREGLARHTIRGPDFRPVIRGVYVAAGIPDSLVVRCRAVQLVAPEYAVFSHFTAARLWCSRALGSAKVHVSFSYNAYMRRAETALHRFTYRLDVAQRHGLPVTSPGMTFMHLAVCLELINLVTLGDQLVKKRVITPEDLVHYAMSWEHYGGAAGLAAARLVRDGVDSQPETHLRLLIVLAGLPEPTVNHVIRRPDGSTRYRIELAYEGIKLAIEYDGRWHDEPEQQRKDEVRRAALRSEGWTFVVLQAIDLYETPEASLAMIVAALRALGVDVPDPDLTDYRSYFSPLLVA